MTVIEVRGVSKKFNLRATAKLLSEHIRERMREENSQHVFYALRNISFTVNKGEGVQIVGANGAGKSTLLGLITQLTPPDSGSVKVNGRVGALLEIGSGFHPDLTGSENLVLNAALIGMSQAQTRELAPKIVEFAELGDFIDQPLRTYSSGMTMRLAFSVAINLLPEVLLVDEVLGVGDAAFQRKCFDALLNLRRQGTTLLCVSHGAGQNAALCSRAIWLHEGELVLDGEYNDTLSQYLEFMKAPDRNPLPSHPVSKAAGDPAVPGSGAGRDEPRRPEIH